VRRFFAEAAPGWDERVDPEGSAHLAPLAEAVERLALSPERVLDVGTGTGAGALWLAQRFPAAELLGIDVAPEMIELARAKAREEGRVRFEVGDVAEAVAGGDRFDLIIHLNCPVVFADVAAALAAGGTVVVAASYGSRTPFYTAHSALGHGFRRAGLEVRGEGEAGDGTWLAAAGVSRFHP
jgi:SAM-dependent methyltransferase